MKKIWQQHYSDQIPYDIPELKHSCLGDLFKKSCEKYPHKVCFSSFGTKMTFKQFAKHVEAFASYFQNELKLKKNNAIALQMPNSLAYPIAMMAALKIGLVIVNTNPLYTTSEMKKQFVDSGVKAIVIFSAMLPKLQEILNQTSIQHVIVTSPHTLLKFPESLIINLVSRIKKLRPLLGLPFTSFEESLKKGKSHTLQRIHTSLDDIAFIQYTGGTTGGSKGAVLSHRNILSNISQVSHFLSYSKFEEGSEVVAVPLPFYHIYAMTISLVLFQKGSHSVLIMNPRDLKSVLNVFKNNKISIFLGINTLFSSLNNYPPFQKLDFSSLKFSLAGGMAINKTVVDLWYKITKKHIYEGYGLTEASPVVTTNILSKKPVYGSIGIPLPSTNVKLVDSQFQEVPLGKKGEICIKGPQIMQGYWKEPEQTKKILQDGWLKTGDVGVFNNEGYLFIVDRIKDMILVSGFNVYPNEIEEVVLKNTKILEAAVIGVPHHKSGEAVKLFVVPKKGINLTTQEVKAHCRESLTSYKVPKFIEFKNTLPKSNVGKVLRKILKDEERHNARTKESKPLI